MGDEDFTPLVTPFAITSLEQQERVLRSPAARNMLRSLGRPGLQGIALLPGELRYPAGVTRDAVRPADFRGATVGSARRAPPSQRLAAAEDHGRDDDRELVDHPGLKILADYVCASADRDRRRRGEQPARVASCQRRRS